MAGGSGGTVLLWALAGVVAVATVCFVGERYGEFTPVNTQTSVPREYNPYTQGDQRTSRAKAQPTPVAPKFSVTATKQNPAWRDKNNFDYWEDTPAAKACREAGGEEGVNPMTGNKSCLRIR